MMDAQEQRRLLDLAAKAAGVEIKWNVMINPYSPFLAPKTQQERNWLGHEHTPWDPYIDDGDSRRLQVALELELRVFNGKAHAGKQDQFWITENWFPDGDPNTASRLAVLRAAAVLGENMP